MTLSLPPAMQLAAYAANFALVVAAWRLHRLRAYALTLLVADVVRFVAGFVPLQHNTSMHDLALYAADGALALAPMVVLAWALRLEHKPVLGLLALAWSLAMIDVYKMRLDEAARVYVASLATAHVYTTIGPLVDGKVRGALAAEGAMLLGLAATGTTGAIVAVTWDDWELVNAGNALAHCAIAIVSMLVVRQQKRRKSSV